MKKLSELNFPCNTAEEHLYHELLGQKIRHEYLEGKQVENNNFSYLTIIDSYVNGDIEINNLDKWKEIACFFTNTTIIFSLLFLPNGEQGINALYEEKKEKIQELLISYDLEQFTSSFFNRIPLAKIDVYNKILGIYIYAAETNSKFLLEQLIKKSNPHLFNSVRKNIENIKSISDCTSLEELYAHLNQSSIEKLATEYLFLYATHRNKDNGMKALSIKQGYLMGIIFNEFVRDINNLTINAVIKATKTISIEDKIMLEENKLVPRYAYDFVNNLELEQKIEVANSIKQVKSYLTLFSNMLAIPEFIPESSKFEIEDYTDKKEIHSYLLTNTRMVTLLNTIQSNDIISRNLKNNKHFYKLENDFNLDSLLEKLHVEVDKKDNTFSITEQKQLSNYMLNSQGISTLNLAHNMTFADWLTFCASLASTEYNYKDSPRDLIFYLLLFMHNEILYQTDNFLSNNVRSEELANANYIRTIQELEESNKLLVEENNAKTIQLQSVPSNWNELKSTYEFDKENKANIIKEKNNQLKLSSQKVDMLMTKMEQKDAEIQELKQVVAKMEFEKNTELDEGITSQNTIAQVVSLLENNKIVIIGGHDIWRAKIERVIPKEVSSNIILHDIDTKLPKGQFLQTADHIFVMTAYCNHRVTDELKAKKGSISNLHMVNNITNVDLFLKYMLDTINTD